MNIEQVGEWFERIALPLVATFTMGALLGQASGEFYAGEERRAVQQARREVARVQAHLDHWRQACQPLVAMPVESAPMVLGGDAMGHQRGTP